jgi:hypothetical protein
MSDVNSTAASVPNVEHIAVGALIAEAMSKSNTANQRQLESQKDIDQQFMEQSIANAIQQIEAHAPDRATALDDIKKFLSQMDAADSNWGSDVHNWVAGELKTANSYSPPSDLLDQLNGDMQQLSEDQRTLKTDEGNLDACIRKRDELTSQMNQLKNKMDSAPWYEKIQLALEIAGLGIAIGGTDAAIGVCQAAVELDKETIGGDKNRISTAEKLYQRKLNSDQGLISHLSTLANSNTIMGQEASESITKYHATVNNVEGVEKSIESIKFSAD